MRPGARVPQAPRTPMNLDELLPPEPEDEPDEDAGPEPEPSVWEEEPAEDLDSTPSSMELELLPGEGAEEEGWWSGAEEELEPEPEDEPSGTVFDERGGAPEAEEGWGRWEEEASALPRGLTLVGWRERALLPEHGIALEALLDTGSAITHLRGVLLGREGDRGRVAVEGRELEVAVEEEGGVLVLRLPLELGGQRLELRALVERADGGPPLRLGRDALAGRFVVDASAEGLLRDRS